MKELEVINMGLIRAAAGAVGGTLADSWLEYITAGDMGANTVMTKGVQIKRGKHGSNTKGTPDIISNGSRVEVSGTMYLKHRGDKLYFNLFINEIRTATADMKDTVKGELVFRGKVGQHIEEKRDKKDQPYTMFSAFSTEKVEDGFEYQWVRFFCFGKEREAWLQPGVRVDAKGEITLSAYNGKVNVSCKVEELVQYVADSSNSNQ